MPYTLWSHHRFLGSTRLRLSDPNATTIIFEFQPTEEGLAVMPVFAEYMRASRGALPAMQEFASHEGETNVTRIQEYVGQFHRGPEGGRLFASLEAIEKLSLELRDGAGEPVATTQLWLQDMLEMVRQHVAEGEELDLEPGFPRYMLSATIAGPA